MPIITYTTILHQAREELGITTNEYCIADIIYHLSNNPKSKIQGWCYASRQTIGSFIGITKSSVLSIIEKLEKKRIIEKDGETKYLRTTEKWFNTVVIVRIKQLGKETIPVVKKPTEVVKKTTEAVKKPTASGIETIPNIYKDNNIYKNKDNTMCAFEKFWSKYPNKKSKKKAQDTWNKIKPDNTLLEVILKAIETAKKTDQWQRGYIPHPTTYLNQERWNDKFTNKDFEDDELLFI